MDEMLGQKFHRLTVVEFYGLSKNKSRLYKCQCDCGNVVLKRGSHLRRGEIKSCGCFKSEDSTTRGRLNIKHGLSHSATYGSWSAMKDRCLRREHIHYKKYGGRGITVCKRWMKFENFLADMGERPAGKTLDRINNDKGYCPENCRWATPKEQSRNTHKNHNLTFNGQTKTITEWAELTGLLKTTIKERLRRGWTIEEVLTVSPKGVAL